MSVQRTRFHEALIERLLVIDKDGVCASNGDKDNVASREISLHIATKLAAKIGARMPAQSAGVAFETMTKDFLEATFFDLNHLRPGDWVIKVVKSRDALALAEFDQYRHLLEIKAALEKDKSLKAIMGNDYIISPTSSSPAILRMTLPSIAPSPSSMTAPPCSPRCGPPTMASLSSMPMCPANGPSGPTARRIPAPRR